jgi:hypothetical protein
LIFKDKVVEKLQSATAKAGQKQERDVAFFLRRNFKEHENVHIFNDLKFEFNDETAQIDHLVLYPFGFVLIESKSITGEVSINSHSEWSRSYNGQWRGMPSPIKQVELQQKLLRDLLFEHRAEILGKVMFKQQSFGGRCWDNICAISSNAIISRDEMPKDVSKQLVKSEFVVDKLLEIMKLRNPVLNKINVLDTRPAFNKEEMDSIARFLLANNKSLAPEKTPVESCELGFSASPKEETPLDLRASKATQSDELDTVWKRPETAIEPQTKCSKCGESEQLIPSYGKYGYYFKCQSCDGNTPMKQPCPQCQSKQTKISKRKEIYTLNCNGCDLSTVIWGK